MLPDGDRLGQVAGPKGADMKVLYIAPVGSDVYLPARAEICEQAGNAGTAIDIVSLPPGHPTHVEYHAYEAMVLAEVVKNSYAAANKYDAFYRSWKIGKKDSGGVALEKSLGPTTP